MVVSPFLQLHFLFELLEGRCISLMSQGFFAHQIKKKEKKMFIF